VLLTEYLYLLFTHTTGMAHLRISEFSRRNLIFFGPCIIVITEE